MKKILILLFLFQFSFKGYSQTSINITYAIDSLLLINDCPQGPAPIYDEFSVKADVFGYSLNDTLDVKILYGDGTYQTYPCYDGGFLSQGNGKLEIVCNAFMHLYLATGVYDVTYIVSDRYGNADTLFHPQEVFLTSNCSSLSSEVFLDNNSNCIYDAGDSIINNVPMIIYNGVSTYQGFKNGNINFSYNIPIGVNYTAVVDPVAIQQLGYSLTCPLSGMINFTSTGSNSLSFAINCNSNYDLSISSFPIRFKLGSSVLISNIINSISCTPQSGNYTLNLGPKLSFVSSFYTPRSGSGSTYNWNYTNLTSVGNQNSSNFNIMYLNLDPSAILGDILCYNFSISPTIGDINPLNNSVNICGTVVSSYDPNFKDVYPKGSGTNGEIPPNTKLTYTIGFQNTGTDTASHVYVLDTLSTNLDINTIRIIYASHPMQFYIIDGHILKFDFRNIQLLDSGSNEMKSHGFVVYEISPNSNLVNGAQLVNSANIYFDFNLPITTNSTINTIKIATGIKEEALSELLIAPNPAVSFLKIISNVDFNGTAKIYDVTGRVILTRNVNGIKTELDVKALISGLYFITILNKNGEIIKTQKIMKE